MQINVLSRPEFIDLACRDTAGFMQRIDRPQAFIVRKFYDRSAVLKLRNETLAPGLASEPIWHPLRDACPDCHRLHDNYPKSYVKQKMHGSHYHV